MPLVTIEAVTPVTASFDAVSPPPSGKLFASGRAFVKDRHALLDLRCAGPQGARCEGVAKLTVSGGKRKGQRKRRISIGSARYDLPAEGGRRTVKVPLSTAGTNRVRQAGKKGLEARLTANGLSRVVALKPAGEGKGKRQRGGR